MTSALPMAFPKLLTESIKRSVEKCYGFLNQLNVVDESDPFLNGPVDGMFGIIGFLGDYNWSFTIICPKESTLSLVKAFTGFDIPYRSSEMADIIGEMANVLAGEVAADLYSKKVSARMSLPTVARGSDVEFVTSEGMAPFLIGYRWEHGTFGFRLVMGRHTNSWARRVGFEKI